MSKWNNKTIADICENSQYGYTTKASGKGNVKFVRTTDISKGKIDWSRVPFCDENPDDVLKYQLKKDDVLISRAGSVGLSYLVEEAPKAVFASYLIRFRPKINPKFFFYFLQSPAYWNQVYEGQAGIAVPNLNASKISAFEIPVPEKNETQEEVVKKIDILFSSVDQGINQLTEALEKLSQYRQSTLNWAIQGKIVPQDPKDEPAFKLLEKIRKEKEKLVQARKVKEGKSIPQIESKEIPYDLPSGWMFLTGHDVFEFVTSGSRGWGEYRGNNGALFLGMSCLDHDTIQVDYLKSDRVSLPKHIEGKRTLVQQGDILLSITADIGMIGVVSDKIEEAYVNQHVALARPSNLFNSEYIGFFLASPIGKKLIRKKQRGATKLSLGLDDIRNAIIPIPPRCEQDRIVLEVKNAVGNIEKIIATVSSNLKDAQHLKQSILKKAFNGEL